MNYALIFGATGKIGEELSLKLASQGENLILSGTNAKKLDNLKDKILSIYNNVSVQCAVCLLDDDNSREEFILKINLLNVKFSGIYYVSGIDTQKEFIKYTPEKIVKQARVNFEGALYMTNYALKNRATNFKILIFSSLTGITPMPYFSEYSSTKSALIYFYTALRYELKGKNVKCTIVAPGSVSTREDVIEDIKKQGLQGKLSSQPISVVVDKSLKALNKNKRIVVIGAYNKLVYFISKITPLNLKLKIIGKKFAKKEKDFY